MGNANGAAAPQGAVPKGDAAMQYEEGQEEAHSERRERVEFGAHVLTLTEAEAMVLDAATALGTAPVAGVMGYPRARETAHVAMRALVAAISTPEGYAAFKGIAKKMLALNKARAPQAWEA